MKEISKIQYIIQAQSKETILNEITDVLEAGIEWVQLRIKNDELDFLGIAKEAKALCAGRATFIINDRVEIAKEVEADGVHLGLKNMSIQEAREILGEKIIGGTANTMADALNHERAGASYVGMGPFAFTETKKELSPIIGLDGFRNLFPKEDSYGWQMMTLNIPVVAIGGIQLEDISSLMDETAVYGIALSGLISKADNKKKIVEEIKASIYGYVEDRG